VSTRKGANGELFLDNSIPHFTEKSTETAKKVSIGEEDSIYFHAVEKGDMKTARKLLDERARQAGFVPVSRYHQTGAVFNEFSNKNPDAGLNDSDTPNGYFFKENDHDIGVGGDFVETGHGGNIQMRVYLKHNNLLYFKNRDEARAWYSDNVPGYKKLLEEYNKHLSDFEKANAENNAKMFEELIALEESGQSTTEKDLAIMEKYNRIMDEWIESREEYEKSLRSRMRELLNQYFIEGDSDYDGIELADDGHRYIDGKREDVHTFIVFKNTQIKSADTVTYDDAGNIIPLSKRFDNRTPDIRFSLKDGANQQTSGDIDELMRSAGIEGDAAEIREDLAELYVKAENLAMDEDSKSGKAFIKRVANRIALNMARLGTVRDGETRETMVERLREEILSRSAFAEQETEAPQEAPKETPKDEPKPKKTGYTYDDVHGMMDAVKKGLTFEMMSGKVVEGKIYRNDAWEVNKKIYHTLKLGELRKKSEVGPQGRKIHARTILYSKLYKMQILYN